MPVYQYTCSKCNSHFELKQGFHDEPKATCPKCQHKGRRLFSATPIIFKGSGFYVTDHKKNNGASEPVAEKKAESKNNGASEPAAEKKAEPKTSSEGSKTSDSKLPALDS